MQDPRKRSLDDDDDDQPISPTDLMSTETTPVEFTFEGQSSKDCEEFIRAIRRRAFAEGKHRDREWMAGFASTCFAGEALMWHSRLEEEIQSDWRLLEQALIERYMSSISRPPSRAGEPSNSPQTRRPSIPLRPPLITIPSSAPPAYTSTARGGSRSLSRGRLPSGRIRVVTASARTSGFIARAVDSNKCHIVTHASSDALRIALSPTQASANLKFLNSTTDHQFLGARWYDSKLELPESDHFAYLLGMTPNQDVSSAICKGPMRTAIWELASDSTLNASWVDEERDLTHVLEVAVNNTSRRIALVGNYNTFVGFNRAGYSKVRLVFEPIAT